MKGENRKEPNTELCRRMLSLQNLEKAISAVKRNKGSAGVDGVKVDEIDLKLFEMGSIRSFFLSKMQNDIIWDFVLCPIICIFSLTFSL